MSTREISVALTMLRNDIHLQWVAISTEARRGQGLM